jgi:hypothetical protein
MSALTQQKRYTVSVDQIDYDALVALGQSVNTLLYYDRPSLRNVIDQYAAQQLSFPLERLP